MQFVIDARVIIPSVKTLDDLFSVDGFDDIGGAIGILRLLRAEEFADDALLKKHAHRQGNDHRIDDERQERT